jgi:hypothetical protein
LYKTIGNSIGKDAKNSTMLRTADERTDEKGQPDHGAETSAGSETGDAGQKAIDLISRVFAADRVLSTQSARWTTPTYGSLLMRRLWMT